MSPIEVNYLAILVAAIISTILGVIWYGPLFGKHWLAFEGATQEKINEAKKGGKAKLYVINFIGALLLAWVLAHFLLYATTYLEFSGLSAGIAIGFFVWLGFVVPATLNSVVWEGRLWKHWFLTNSYQLLNLLIIGVILVLWQ